jgi:hypothetical protein
MSRCEECGWSGANCGCADKAQRLRDAGLVKLGNLVDMFEATHVVNLTDTRIRQLRREGKFCEPVKSLHCGDLWLRADLEEWVRTRVKKRAGRPAGPRRGPDVEDAL